MTLNLFTFALIYCTHCILYENGLHSDLSRLTTIIIQWWLSYPHYKLFGYIQSLIKWKSFLSIIFHTSYRELLLISPREHIPSFTLDLRANCLFPHACSVTCYNMNQSLLIYQHYVHQIFFSILVLGSMVSVVYLPLLLTLPSVVFLGKTSNNQIIFLCIL